MKVINLKVKEHAHSIRHATTTKDGQKKLFHRTARFLRDSIHEAFSKAWKNIKSLFENAESVVILGLATVGTAGMIGEFVIGSFLAEYIVALAVAPLLAVGIIWGLLKIGDLRENHRLHKIALRNA